MESIVKVTPPAAEDVRLISSRTIDKKVFEIKEQELTVKISAQEGNQLAVKDDGLFVAKPTELEALKAAGDEAKNQITTLNTKVAALEAKDTELKTALDEAKTAVLEAKAEIADLKAKLEAAFAKFNNQFVAIEEFDGEVTAKALSKDFTFAL